MMKKRILSLVVVMTMMLSFMPVIAQAATSGTCGDNLTWTLDDNGTLTISGEGAMANWSSSSYVPWYSSRDSIQDVIIGNSVTSIGDWAFWCCSSLTSVTIPDSVTSIGGSAFCYCSSLESVVIPDSVTSIGEGAFYDCRSLESAVIPDSVTSIGSNAFSACSSLTSIEIPYSVTSIGSYAFCYCSSLTSISVDINNQYYSSENGILFNKDKTTIIQYAIGKTDTKYTIPDSVTSIGVWAFEECSSLESVVIPNSVTSIGVWAFEECSSLTDVYYGGSEEQWRAIRVGIGNEDLTNATIHYNSMVSGTDTPKPEPTSEPIIIEPTTEPEPTTSPGEKEPIMRSKSSSGNSNTKGKYGFSVTLDEADRAYLEKFISGITYTVNSVSENFSIDSSPTYIISEDGKTAEYYITGTVNGDYSVDIDIYSAGGQKVHHKATSSTSYGVPTVTDNSTNSNNSSTTDIELKSAANKWIQACNDYIALLAEKCEKSAKEADENTELQVVIEKKAKELMGQDAKNSWFGLPAHLPEDAELYCYEALYEAIIAGGERENIDFGSVKTGLFGTISTNTKIVNTISKAINNISFEKQYGKYKITINATGFNGAYTGSINVRNLQGYGTYWGMLTSPQDATLEVVADYIIALRDLEINAICSVFTAAANDLKIKSVNDLTKNWIKKNLKKNIKIFQDKGFGQVDEFLGNCVQYYQYVSKLNKTGDISEFVNDAKTTLDYSDKLSNSNYTASDAALNKAMSVVKNAESELKDRALDYLYGTGYDFDKEDKGFVNFVKSIFKCPVSIGVYNSNDELIGYVGDDDIWYDDSIIITQEGDVKTIYSNQVDEIYFDIKGTDYGTLNCVFEEYDNNMPVGRTNFYDIPLYQEKNLSCTLLSGNNSTAVDNLIIQSDNEEIYADEYISSTENAATELNVITDNCNYGTIFGAGTYIRGDQAVLTAIPNDDCAFIGWFNGEEILSLNMVYEFTVKKDTNITAKFAKTEYTLENVFFETLEMYADDIDDISAVKNNDSFNITITTKNDSDINLDNSKMYIVAYDDNDALKQVNVFDITKTDNKNVFTVDIPQQEFSVFIWNNDNAPITKVNFGRKQYAQ